MNKKNCTLHGDLCKHYPSERCNNCKRKYVDLYEKPDNPMPPCPKCGTNTHVGKGQTSDFFWCLRCMGKFINDPSLE